jgi:hypothetical protein
MKTRIYAIVVSLLLVVSVSFAGMLALQNVNLNNQIAVLGNQLYLTQSRVQTFETREANNYQNNVSIYLEDPHNFIARGVVSLDKQAAVVSTYYETRQDGSKAIRYLYRLGDVPVLITSSGEWVRVEAVKGETIHLMTSSYNNGPDYIAYYACHTNSTYCTIRTTETDILAQQ